MFLPDGMPLGLGETLRQPLLGRHAPPYRAARPRGFYEGPVADDMVGRLRALGGLHTLDDFASQQSRL